MSYWLVESLLNKRTRVGPPQAVSSRNMKTNAMLRFMFFSHMLGGAVFIFGVTKRLILTALFTSAYFISLKMQGS